MKIILLILAAGLIYLLQDYVYTHFWDKHLTAVITFQDRPVLEGEEACLTEVIENRKLLPLTYLNAKFSISQYLRFDNMENTSVSDFLYKSDVFSVLFHQRITRKLTFRCLKRGYYEIKQADLVSANLLMTREMVRTCPQDTHLYVYPKYLNIDSLKIPFRKITGTAASKRFLYEDPFEFRGIRSYTRTDPMNSINWKASARTGELMVNVHDSTASQETVIILNLESESIWIYEQLLEMAIRLAASVSYCFLRDSVPTRMICNGSDCITGQACTIPSGNGLQQVNAISQALARIDLNLPVLPCVSQLHDLSRMPGNTLPLYIMISSNMSGELQNAFRELTKESAGALWIAPLYENMELRVKPAEGMEIVKWEVDQYES